MKRIWYTCIIVALFSQCDTGNNQAPGKNSPAQETTADTSAANAMQKTIQHEHPDSCEINVYAGFPLDSMRIRYRSMLDTLYGHRNKDTLMIEGDVKVVYPSQDKGIKGVGTTDGLWPKNSNGKLIIPYQIRSDYGFSSRVEKALQMWQAGLPNIKFVKQNFENDYLVFIPSIYTQSFIGRIGEGQTIELSNRAMAGNIAHEIGHALGLYHEHSRSDRDAYVHVLCPDDSNYRHAYKTDPYAVDIGTYNYNSIMHYPMTDCLGFPADLSADITPGQRVHITPGDFAAIKKIYRFPQ